MGKIVDDECFATSDFSAVTMKFVRHTFVLLAITFMWILIVTCQRQDNDDYERFLRKLERCPPKRCQLCKKHFGSTDFSKFDCLGNCSLCQFCTPDNEDFIPECKTYCQGGIYKCALTCDQGKMVCEACHDICAIYQR